MIFGANPSNASDPTEWAEPHADRLKIVVEAIVYNARGDDGLSMRSTAQTAVRRIYESALLRLRNKVLRGNRNIFPLLTPLEVAAVTRLSAR